MTIKLYINQCYGSGIQDPVHFLPPDPGSDPYFWEFKDNFLGWKYLNFVSIDSNIFLYLLKKYNNL
jgi:hypothetical protein